MIERRLSVAPMMDWTDRHCRMFHRVLSPHALLYSEMIHTNAILRSGNEQKYLSFRPEEGAVALQLGGSDPQALAQAAKRGAAFGYCEINLNCGCPSPRVQSGSFGACLMHEPVAVAQMVAAMRDVVDVPVTVKTRLGLDQSDSYEFLCEFIETVRNAGGCDTFILHARKAWLKGLSPKENRDIPPLDWDRVARLKRDYPELHISINGGLQNVAQVATQLQAVDGAMIGREAYHRPYFLAELEQAVFDAVELPPHAAIAERLLAYMLDEQARGTLLRNITRHALGLYHAQPQSKMWKQALMLVAAHNDVAALRQFLVAAAP